MAYVPLSTMTSGGGVTAGGRVVDSGGVARATRVVEPCGRVGSSHNLRECKQQELEQQRNVT